MADGLDASRWLMAVRRPRARPAVTEAARQRRVGRAAAQNVEIEWFIKDVNRTVSTAMRKRVKLATDFVKNRVIK